ncbi:sulfatase [Saprospiraceae bacterium]|jgi:arylsulfatase A-like enzyme|nr:sulfatase [Bacteroidota bacterium]MDB4727560.1 sulfatase [Saprospiraceae bacterium]
MNKIITKAYFILLFIPLFSCNPEKETPSPNILFIAIDDLRPELGCYGKDYIISPRLDKIASEGTLFTNHFTQVPTCGPSRYCLLTGMYPKGRTYLNNNIAEKVISHKKEDTIPETFIHHLRRNGYHTVGIGKISHSADGYLYGYRDSVSTIRELPFSWDEILFNPGKWETGWNAFFAYANGENRQSLKKQVKPYENGKVSDNGYPDGLSADLTINKLKELKNSTKPFFLGVGFFKPHLPFNSPEEYWQLYNRDSIPISPNPLIPQNAIRVGLHNSGEFNQYQLGEEKATLDQPISVDYAKKIRHAYAACISYIDFQVGRIMDELEALDLDENTIIVVWGDHGWHLGDQQLWGKHSLFENALKSTLIIKVPTLERQNKIASSIVETVDIYPTLMKLTNMPIDHSIDGKDFLSMITNPNYHSDKEMAYGFFKKGITLRTNEYRLTKHYIEKQPNIELYDHQKDPFETTNIALENPEIVEQLLPILEKGKIEFDK